VGRDLTDARDSSRVTTPWRDLMSWAALLVAGLLVVVMAISGAVIPPLVVFVILFCVGAALLRRQGRFGVILLLVVAALFVLLNLPFLVPALGEPASWFDFVTAVIGFVGALVVVISAVAELRRAQPRGARTLGLTGIGIAVGAVVIALVARLGVEESEARSGDISVVAQDNAFQRQEIEADPGRVAIFVDNKDELALHTFTIDELDVNLAVPGGTAGRVTFDAEPGEYEFYCVPHEGLEEMRGTLVVQ
jgi:plastocyanin